MFMSHPILFNINNVLVISYLLKIMFKLIFKLYTALSQQTIITLYIILTQVPILK